jgi:hypothetical protein
MMDDPIVEEVHRIREEILAKYGGDLHALIADAQRRTEEAARAGRKVASPVSGKMEPQIESPKKVAG